MSISQFPPVSGGGIPTGDTADRPVAPSTGDVFYNGQKAILEIYNGTSWVPCSAPAATPTIAVADVGTGVAYGSAQAAITITAGTSGGPADSYLISASTGGYTATTTGTTVNITVGNNGSWTFTGQGVNSYGTSLSGPSSSATLTTVPQAPTIGTATTSGATTDVTVTWTLGNNGGKNLSAITITPYLNGTTAQTATTAATTSSTSATITGLTMGSNYTFKVKTTNANGTSLESSATGSVTIPTLIPVQYLVIAGGGGGGDGASGSTSDGAGGGAGGYRSSISGESSGGGASAEAQFQATPNTNYTVTIGAGGAGSTNPNTQPAGGNSSVFSTITSTGGGAGASNNTAATAGGSGGGGHLYVGVGAGTANQGYAGGTTTGNDSAGGGGGAGGTPANGTNGVGGDGGAGVASSVSGSSISRAGGGGGGGSTGGTATAGGGNGGSNNAGSAGSSNTGGGGGGSAGGIGDGGNGGSGIVFLKYPDTRTITIGAGLTGTTSSSGGYTVATITAGSGNVSWA